MFDSIFNALSSDTTVTLSGLLIALFTALVLGLAISAVYQKTKRQSTSNGSFALTLVILPVIITVIILLVGNNVARAFSLAGAFSIIRFRSAPGDPRDIAYVLLCMAVGLAAGMGFIVYAVLVTLIVIITLIVLDLTSFGSAKLTERLLKITLPENVDPEVLEPALSTYTERAVLERMKTTDLGSLYELTYAIRLKDDSNAKDFIDELRCHNGNLNISLMRIAPDDAR